MICHPAIIDHSGTHPWQEEVKGEKKNLWLPAVKMNSGILLMVPSTRPGIQFQIIPCYTCMSGNKGHPENLHFTPG
jgi:hypothetical protein